VDRETIIKLAREAGLIDFRDALSSHYVQAVLDDLERFANLVAQHERQAIAKMVKPLDESLADEILARGQ
jgi:hypothetical protein